MAKIQIESQTKYITEKPLEEIAEGDILQFGSSIFGGELVISKSDKGFTTISHGKGMESRTIFERHYKVDGSNNEFYASVIDRNQFALGCAPYSLNSPTRFESHYKQLKKAGLMI